MKIISRFKDYYDYLQDEFGVDDNLVLDRTKFFTLPYELTHLQKIKIFIGQYLIEGLYDADKKKFVYGEELDNYAIKYDKNNNKHYHNWQLRYAKSLYGNDIEYDDFIEINLQVRKYRDDGHFINKNPINVGEESLCYKYEYPIIFDSSITSIMSKYEICPVLKDFNIQSIMSAKDVWLELSRFLGELKTMKEADVPVGNDETRIKSHGFDTKTSFRNMKR